MPSLKRITAVSSFLVAILMVVSLWLHQRDGSDAKLIAVAISTYPGPDPGSTPEAKEYSRGYRSGWLSLVSGSLINHDGYIEPPAGEFMDAGFRGGQREAWRSLDQINRLEAPQRLRVYKAVHAYATLEIRKQGIISVMKQTE